MAQNYSQMLADEKDPQKRAIMKAQLDKAGLKYTMPTDTNAPILGPSREDLLKGAATDSQPMQTPTFGTQVTTQPTTQVTETGTVYVPGVGTVDKATSKVISPEAQPSTPLSVQDALIKARQDAENSAKERARLLTESAKARALTEKNTALSKLTEQRGTVEPRFGEARKQAVVGSTLATKRLADLIPFSGGMAGTQVKAGEDINTELQQRQSTLDVQKQQELQDIASREQDVQRAYESSVSQAELGALEQANAEIARIGEIYAGRTIDEIARQEGITREEAQLKKTEADREKQRVEQNYAATINPLEDQTAIIQRLKAQGVPDDDYRIVAHQKVRIQKLGQMADREYEAELARIKDEDERQKEAFETAKWKFEQGMPADNITATLLRIPVGSVIPSQRIKEAELELSKDRARKSSGVGSGSSQSGSDQIQESIVKTSTLKSQVDKNVTDMLESRMLEPTQSTVRQLRADEIIKYAENNQITDEQARELIATYGLTQADVEQAERRYNLTRSMGGR